MHEADRPTGRADDATTSRATLATVLRASRYGADTAKLRAAVRQHVDAARGRGDRVERVIIDLKQEMHAAGLFDRHAAIGERSLAESVIRWCIERYYGPASTSNEGST